MRLAQRQGRGGDCRTGYRALWANGLAGGIDGVWKPDPTTWHMGYLETLFDHEWALTKSPAGAHQWRPVGNRGAGTVLDAHAPPSATSR